MTIPDDPLLRAAMDKAYRLLARRARSEWELRAKLRDRGLAPSTIDQVIARLCELNYLNDASFARQWAAHLAFTKRYGYRRIRRSLEEKGLAADLIREALEELRPSYSETETARSILRQKGKDPAQMDRTEKRRWIDHLIRRGFPPSAIYETLNRPEEEYVHDDGK